MTINASAWFLDTIKQPLVRRDLVLEAPEKGQAIVAVEACGLCHTDLGFADGGVAPRHALPLVLGHEVVGRVVEAGPGAEALLKRRVIVPAVMPCGECVFCKAGRGNACPQQKMPGNDIHGGFATHMTVPAGSLVPVDDVPATVDARALSVVADAVSTAWQAIVRADLQKGDVAFVVGAGGVGGFLAQMAIAQGARVVTFDIDDARLKAATGYGATALNVKDRPPKDVRKEAHGMAKKWEVPSLRWRVFECSGTTPGQQLAYTLMGQASTVVFVGFTPATVEVRLSNVMAFDATIHGTWGCPPSRYADVLSLVFAGKVKLDDAVTYVPMSEVNKVLDDMAHHRLQKRAVLIP